MTCRSFLLIVNGLFVHRCLSISIRTHEIFDIRFPYRFVFPKQYRSRIGLFLGKDRTVFRTGRIRFRIRCHRYRFKEQHRTA